MLVARPVGGGAVLAALSVHCPGDSLHLMGSVCEGAVPIFLAIIPVLAGLPDAAIFSGVAFIVVLISLILQGWTVAAAARNVRSGTCRHSSRPPVWTSIFPAGSATRNTVAGYRVEARLPWPSLKPWEALAPFPPTASVLVMIFGMGSLAALASPAPPLAAGDYLLALGTGPEVIFPNLDRVFGQRQQGG